MEKLKIILLLSFILFATTSTIYSQDNPPPWVGISVGSTIQGASQDLLTEYSIIISKHDTNSNKWWETFSSNITKADKERLEVIFKKMNKDQQVKQKVAFIKGPSPLKKVTPSIKKFNSWKKENLYGVWVDGKKVSNAEFSKFKNTDFAQATVSKLYGEAKKNKKYVYQVNLMTNSYYKKYYDDSVSNNYSRMVFRN